MFKVLFKRRKLLYIEDAELIQDSIYSKFDLVLRIMLSKRLYHALVIVCLRQRYLLRFLFFLLRRLHLRQFFHCSISEDSRDISTFDTDKDADADADIRADKQAKTKVEMRAKTKTQSRARSLARTRSRARAIACVETKAELRVFLKMMTTAIREREKEEVRIISASSIKQQER